MYDKQKLKYVITKYHNSDKNNLSPSATVKANLAMMDLIDTVMRDNEKISWDEFIERCERIQR